MTERTVKEELPAAKVVHLVPRDGLGGVEAAVRSLDPKDHPDLAVLYMAGPLIAKAGRLFRALSPTRSLRSPTVYWSTLRAVMRMRPEVLVCSLWRATLVGVFAKLLRPKIKLVVMIHATTVAHVPDRLITTVGCRFATRIWCDSEASKLVAQQRFGRAARSVSFLVPASAERSSQGAKEAFDFVYWGRHVHLKDVPRAVRLFNRVLARRPQARLYIYGQEGPATDLIRGALKEAADPTAIRLMGAKPPGEYPPPIPSCSFFLMTSTQEGMAVAVVEAMQLGLIPVVTPVGEIANYCKSGSNAIVVSDDDAAAFDVIEVATDSQKRSRMSAAAMEYWGEVPDYSTDFKCAYRELLVNSPANASGHD